MSESESLPSDIEEAAYETSSSLIPEKSRERYEQAFKKYEEWCKKMEMENITQEKVLLSYFNNVSKEYRPSSLWTFYSMIRSMISLKRNIDISKYSNLVSLLKRNSEGYEPKKSKVLTKSDIAKFLLEANDDKYLFIKVALVVGVAGACRMQELVNITVCNIKDKGNFIHFHLPCTKSKASRQFVVSAGDIPSVNLIDLIKKYAALRPKNVGHNRFFLNYRNSKCTKQAVGINKFGSLPKKIATFLKLQNPELYTGHCFRRSCTSLMSGTGVDILPRPIEHHGGWNSNTLAEGYIEHFIETRRKPASNILEKHTVDFEVLVDPYTSSENLFEHVKMEVVEEPSSPKNTELGLNTEKTTCNRPKFTAPGMYFGSEVGGYKLEKLVIEGKTKQVWDVVNSQDEVLVLSKDRITAGDGVKAHDLEGKAEISNQTNKKIFEILNSVGIKTAFVKSVTKTAFIAKKCEMVPIEWVTRRLATGSFLKRNPGVPEGYRFNPPKQETFFKDDANHDPQWSDEQIISAGFRFNGRLITKDEVDIMKRTTLVVFEVLERAWASRNCALIDMKIEFGISPQGEVLLADVIDSDSWRLWPAGDKRLMKDKQVYRNLVNVTQADLDTIKNNFKWIEEQLTHLSPPSNSLVVVLMGSPSDEEHCTKIAKHCSQLGLNCHLRCTSAHKGTSETLQILAEYEGSGQPVVLVAVAGRSNGLGPVLSGNSVLPVINCPPLAKDCVAQDVWSSLKTPSGLGCTTVLYPEAAALAAAQIFALHDHILWAKLRVKALHNYMSLKEADKVFRLKQ